MTIDTGSEDVVAQQWICTCCGYIYDPSLGDPEHGVPPGTPFEQLPAGWRCPLCKALKDLFERN